MNNRNFSNSWRCEFPACLRRIRAGNIKCEYIIGVRRIGHRHVQLKLIAEVVDPGANPLKTHGMPAPLNVSVQADSVPEHDLESEESRASMKEDGRKMP